MRQIILFLVVLFGFWFLWNWVICVPLTPEQRAEREKQEQLEQVLKDARHAVGIPER